IPPIAAPDVPAASLSPTGPTQAVDTSTPTPVAVDNVAATDTAVPGATSRAPESTIAAIGTVAAGSSPPVPSSRSSTPTTAPAAPGSSTPTVFRQASASAVMTRTGTPTT